MRLALKFSLYCAATFTLMLSQTAAPAQANSPEIEALLERLDAQEARIRQLESQLPAVEAAVERLPATPPAAPAWSGTVEPMPPVAGPSYYGVSSNDQVLRRLDAVEAELADISVTRTSDEAIGEWREVSQKWDINWGGRIQWDWCNWADQSPSDAAVGGQNYQEFRRIRFVTSGSAYGVYDYKFEVEFSPQDFGTIEFGGISITDVYMGMHEVPLFGYLRFGHQKVPWGLEWMQSSNTAMFIERGLPIIFSPARDVGLSALDWSDSERMTWHYGVFFDDNDGALLEQVDMNQGVTTSLRITGLPLWQNNGRQFIHLGWASRYTHDRDNQVRFRSRPEIHDGVAAGTFFDTGTLNCKDYSTHVLEMAGVFGPFSVQSELNYAHLQTPGSDANLYGAYVQASYFLTGENRAYDRHTGSFTWVKPHTNFFLVRTGQGVCTGSGAWEIAGRWSYLDATDIDQGQLQDFTLGLNWYMNPRMRLMFNYIHPFGTDAGGVLGFQSRG